MNVLLMRVLFVINQELKFLNHPHKVKLGLFSAFKFAQIKSCLGQSVLKLRVYSLYEHHCKENTAD